MNKELLEILYEKPTSKDDQIFYTQYWYNIIYGDLINEYLYNR